MREDVAVSRDDDLTTFPEDLVALCLDANAMSKGRLNVEAVADLLEVIESQELTIEVWVPEPVLWEWAEHLAADLENARASYEGVRAQVAAAGADKLMLSAWATPIDIYAVIADLQAAVEELEGAHILRLRDSPEAAIGGLRDQVLVQRAGRRKSNVKTGAADSASFRLAEAELSKTAGSMVVVSGDQDARAYFVNNPRVGLVASLSRAKAGILGMRAGSEIALERVQNAVVGQLPRLSQEELGDPDVEGVGGFREDSRLRGRIVESALQLLAIDEIVGVAEVEVSKSEGYAAAMVEARVSVERSLQVLSEVNGLIEMDVERFDGVPALVEVSAQSDDGIAWHIDVDKVHL